MPAQIVSEIQEHLSEYVSGRIELHEFEDWFVSVLWDLAEEPDDAASDLAGHIHNLIAETSRGDRTLDSLREELAEAVRPFASRAVENSARISLESLPVLLSFDRACDHGERRSSNFLAIEFQDEKHGVTSPARRGSNVSRDDQPKSAWSALYFRREYPGYRISNRDSYSVTSEHSQLKAVLVNV